MTPDAVRVRDFVGALFEGLTGYINLRTFPPVEQAFIPVGDMSSLESFAKPRRDRNVYLGVAARLSIGDGSLKNCGGLPALFADIDFKDSSEEEARARIAASPIMPSITIRSGGGLQAYWLLREPIDLQREASTAKTLLRRLAKYLGGDLASAEPARVLRLPRTKNFKYDPPRPVVLEHFEPSLRYNPCDFDDWLPLETEVPVLQSTTSGAIPSGSRNSHLTSLGGTMRKRGMGEAAICAALLVENNERCQPPLSEHEVRRIAGSVARYSPDATNPLSPGTGDFQRLDDGRYQLRFDSLGIVLEIDRLRRQRHELIGELTVRADIAGARTIDGVLSVADFNLSMSRAREERARLLEQRASTKNVDWYDGLEQLCQRVLAAERAGEPAILLHDAPLPDRANDALNVHGLAMPRRHPSILFGDGGSMKSYVMLLIGGELAKRGLRVGFFDWELDAPDHRERLERLFGNGLPRLWYARCERPLIYEADRLRRIVKAESLDYALFDSVGFACSGAPESAEAALGYFQAVRQLGPIGSLHCAHITKTEGGDQKPFGSTFWHASARATWFIRPSEESREGVLSIGVFPRKSNLGPLRSPVGFEIEFSNDRTTFRRIDLANVPDLAVRMSIMQRVNSLLRSGPKTRAEIAEHIGGKPDSIKKSIDRGLNKGFLVLLPGNDGGEPRIGLASRIQ
jgi:hypothetical protein